MRTFVTPSRPPSRPGTPHAQPDRSPSDPGKLRPARGRSAACLRQRRLTVGLLPTSESRTRTVASSKATIPTLAPADGARRASVRSCACLRQFRGGGCPWATRSHSSSRRRRSRHRFGDDPQVQLQAGRLRLTIASAPRASAPVADSRARRAPCKVRALSVQGARPLTSSLPARPAAWGRGGPSAHRRQPRASAGRPTSWALSLPEASCELVVLGLGAGGDHLLVLDVLAGERGGVVRQREPDQRAGAALRRAEERRAERGEDLPDPVLVLAEAGAHDAGVKAVGVQLRRAPGQLAREEDVAQLRGAVDAQRSRSAPTAGRRDPGARTCGRRRRWSRRGRRRADLAAGW